MYPQHLSASDRGQLLDALRRGVPPSAKGLLAIKVGREAEIKALLASLKTAMGGGYAFRVITGNYGAGKSFLLELMRASARSNKGAMLSMRAELSPERRFIGTSGQPTELWRSLVSSLTTNDSGEAGEHQLRAVLEQFVKTVGAISSHEGKPAALVMQERLDQVSRLEHGDQLVGVVRSFWLAAHQGDEGRMQAAVQWIKAGFESKVEAKRATGVAYRDIGLVSRLQLLSGLARAAGWNGLFVCIDEVDKVCLIPHEANRMANFQEVLRLANLDGARAPGLAVFLSGAPAFVDDGRVGSQSVPALYRRLSPNRWANVDVGQELVDHRSTVLRLDNLSAADSHDLLSRIRSIHCHTEEDRGRVPESVVAAFLAHSQQLVGNETHLKPSNTVKEFVGFLDVLDQNRSVDWRTLLKGVKVARAGATVSASAGMDADDYDQRI